MQQFQQICIVQNHNQLPVTKYCTYTQCQLSRYLCDQCIGENLHQHDHQNSDYYTIDPISFKLQVDQKFRDIDKIYDEYAYLDGQFRETQSKQRDKEEQAHLSIENERKRLQSLITLTDLRNKPPTMITEQNIQHGLKIMNEDLLPRYKLIYYPIRKYLDNLQLDVDQISLELIKIRRENIRLKANIIKKSKYERRAIMESKIPIQASRLSREENYLVLLDYKGQTIIVDLMENKISQQNHDIGKDVVELIFIESQNLFIVGTFNGCIYTYELIQNLELKLISKWQVTEEEITQIFDQYCKSNIILCCISGRILIVNSIHQEIVKSFKTNYQNFSNFGYSYNRQILGYSYKGKIQLWEMHNFETLLEQPHENQENQDNQLNIHYAIAFSLFGNQIALYSNCIKMLQIYDFKQKPKIELILSKTIQQSYCICVQWINDDDFLAVQYLENTQILDAESFDVVRIIETNSRGSMQLFESKNLDYIIDFEKTNIVRYDS